MKKSFIKITSLAFGSILFFAACGGNKESKDPKKALADLKTQQKEIQTKIAALEEKNGGKDSVRKVAVSVTSMQTSTFNNYVEVQGKVDIDEVVNAIPETPGIISEITVTRGQHVNKGQIVARLRAESVDKGIDELDQQISFSKILYDKQQSLWNQGVGTEIQLLSAKNQYDALLKKKQSILTTRSTFNVYSPISGVVDAIDARVGQSYASPINPPLIRIINTGKLKIKADIAENYASTIKTGNMVKVIFSDIHDTLITKISYAEHMINNVSRTYATYIPLPANAKYQPNMLAQVKIATYQNPKAFVLPASVIQKTEQGNFVYIMDENNKAKLLQVQIGNTYEGKVEIISGLALGEKVVTTGYEELNEGDFLVNQ